MKNFNRIAGLFFCFNVVLGVNQLNAQAKTETPPQGTYRNIYDMLKDVPGLDVKSSGNGGTITVRGTASLRSQGQPLFVVDGTIYDGDISNLSPADISNISVLKDAASGTAYGTRGMFGVIVITTKKGTGVKYNAPVQSHEESAYTYFIKNKTPLRVFGMNDEVLIEGVIQRQQDTALVFIKKRKELLINIDKIKRVEMMPVDQ